MSEVERIKQMIKEIDACIIRAAVQRLAGHAGIVKLSEDKWVVVNAKGVTV